MKNAIFLFLLMFHFHSFSQNTENTLPSKPFIMLKDGSMLSVKYPVVICENMCYFTNRYTKSLTRKPLSEIEGFSSGSDVRWMTSQEFKRIGTRSVHGYFWSVVTFYPTGLGIFILTDIIKRRQIRDYYQFSLYTH